MKTTGIVGAGLIGRAWAQVFARAGWSVAVWDPEARQREAAYGLIENALHESAAHGLVDDPAAAAKRVRVVATLEEAVREADYVQESGPEKVDVKRETFVQLDKAARKDAILASSTSAIVP